MVVEEGGAGWGGCACACEVMNEGGEVECSAWCSWEELGSSVDRGSAGLVDVVSALGFRDRCHDL